MTEHEQRYEWFKRDHDPNGELEALRSKITAANKVGMPFVGIEDAVKMVEYIDKLILQVMYPPHAMAG